MSKDIKSNIYKNDETINFISERKLFNNDLDNDTIYFNEILLKLDNKNIRLEKINTNDSLFYIFNNKLYLYSNKKHREIINNYQKIINIENTESSAISLCKSVYGGFWVGASKGFYFIDNNLNSILDSRFSGLSFYYRVDALLEKDSILYLGTLNGLYSYNKATDSLIIIELDKEIQTKRIKQIIEVDNKLWFSTKTNGIIIYGDSIKNIRTENGLLSNNINSITSNNDYVWIATDKGVNRISIKTLQIVEEKDINKIIKTEISQVIVLNDKLYFTTGNNLLSYQLNQKEKNIKIPLILTRVAINEKDTSLLNEYNLSYNKNNIQLEFKALTFKDAQNVRYKYLLEGLSEEWNIIDDNKLHFEYLPSGDYTLHLSLDNYIPEKEIIIRFNIQKPFWEKWWFIISSVLLLFLVLSLAMYLFYRQRLIRKEHESNLKEDINKYRQQALNKQLNPHFIFNSLNSIQKYILKNDRMKSSNYLSKFAALMRSNLNNSLSNLITIEKELEALTLYLDLEAMRFDNKFEYKININNQELLKNKIPPMLIQPYVENAIWHGIMHSDKQGEILINFDKQENIILISITDNGVGRRNNQNQNIERKHKSVGTNLTENRIEVINSLYKTEMTLKYIDLKDENQTNSGTKVILSIPIIL